GRQIAERLDDLEGAGDAGARHFVRRLAGDLTPIEDDPPAIGSRETGQTVKARRLAGAVRAEESQDLTLLDSERDDVERNEAGKALGEPHPLEDAHQVTRRGASPPFRTSPRGRPAPAKPALEQRGSGRMGDFDTLLGGAHAGNRAPEQARVAQEAV